MLRLAKLAIVALMAAILATPVAARAPEWIELGQHTVSLFDTDDYIAVGRGEGAFTRLRLEVRGNDLDLRSIRVRFLSGDEHLINVDQRIRENTMSPAFDLPGNRRGIQGIVLRYNGRPIFGGKPVIRIFGEKIDGPAPPQPAPPPQAGRPAILDTQMVSNAADRIVFNVGADEGAITQIRLRALNGSLLYRAIEVTFGGDQTQMIEGIERLEAGEQGKPIDLTGNMRVIKKVTVFKRPSFTRGETKVELLGLVVPRPQPGRADGFEIAERAAAEHKSSRVVFDLKRPTGPVEAIKIKAVDGDTLIGRVEIVSRDGRTQGVDLMERLQAGASTRAIEVQGRGDIERVIVTKRPSFRPGEMRLVLMTQERRGPPPRPVPPPPQSFGPGWVMVGHGALPPAERSFGTPAVQKALVRVGREVGQFKAIGLRVRGDEVNINAVTVVYANGERDRITANMKLENGKKSPPAELRGERFIKEIEVEYIKRSADRSVLEVFGEYADNWLGDRGRRRDFNQGWVLLGSQRAAVFGGDTDVFEVGRRFGEFRSLKITSRDHAVRFYGLRIVYANGQEEDVPFSGELSPGQSSPALDLRGRERFVDKIVLRYRTKLNFQGDGVVEVWGLK